MENKGAFNKVAQTLFNKPKVSQIHLDEMGNFIWPLMDGKRTVYDISQLVKEEFGEKAEPLYNRPGAICKESGKLWIYKIKVILRIIFNEVKLMCNCMISVNYTVKI